MTPCKILLKPLTRSVSPVKQLLKSTSHPDTYTWCAKGFFMPLEANSGPVTGNVPFCPMECPILSQGTCRVRREAPSRAVPGGSRCEGTWFPRCPFPGLVLPLSPLAGWILAAASCHIPSSGIAPCILCLLLLSNGSLTPLSLIVFDYPRQSLSLPRRVPRGIPPLPCINQHKHPWLSAGWIQPL